MQWVKDLVWSLQWPGVTAEVSGLIPGLAQWVEDPVSP